MNLIAQRTLSLQGKVTVPGSKSQSIRGLLFALLSKGESTLLNVLDSEDIRDAIRVCESLGASITMQNKILTISSEGVPFENVSDQIHSGNSGITTRFLIPLLGLRQNIAKSIFLECGDQMRVRPIQPLVKVLRELGLAIQCLSEKDQYPISISGKLMGGKVEVAGITSQFLSALLISLPCAENDSEITVRNLHERPYVEMTLGWLRDQNILYSHEIKDDSDTFFVKGRQIYKRFSISITGDFSSASYLIAAAVLTNSYVEIEGLDMRDVQGDKQLITILQQMGADIHVTPHQLIIRGGKKLTGLKIDANDIPDLLPTLAVIGTAAVGKMEICNVRQARIKETDRIHSMVEGLSRLGARVEEYEDGIAVYQSELRGTLVKGYGDHRTVMALAIAGLLAEGTTVIDDGEAISKTFPTFVEMMQSLGARIEVKI